MVSRMKAAKGEEYLQMYPEKTGRWMNQCVACQRKGYRPDMPRRIHPGLLAQHLRHYFAPLDVDEKGMCEQCRAAVPETR
jgi:hypothetical protein